MDNPALEDAAKRFVEAWDRNDTQACFRISDEIRALINKEPRTLASIARKFIVAWEGDDLGNEFALLDEMRELIAKKAAP